MGKKNLSPFGFMIELLDVPVTEIAARIYVTQSLVSKWKSGARSLKKSSEYYEAVVNYFVGQNAISGQNALQNLFDSLYTPDDLEESDYLRSCMSRFLSNEDVPPAARSLLCETKKNLYTSSISVFIGTDGRKAAISMLLDAAENAGEGEIFLLEHENLFWQLEDPDFAEQLQDQLLFLLDMGIRLHVVHYLSCCKSDCAIYMREFHSVLFHKNTREYFYYYYTNVECTYSHYVLKGQLSVLGLNPSGKEEQLYTAVYRDPFTLLQHERVAENTLAACSGMLKVQSGNGLQLILDKMKHCGVRDEDFYLSNTAPDLITLSEELLIEILDYSNVSGKARNRCVAFYKALRKIALEKRSWHFYSMESIRRRVGMKEVPYYGLSEVAGKSVMASASQFRRHLMEVVQMMGARTDFEVALTASDDELLDVSGIWCKENLWSMSFDNRELSTAKFTEEPVVANETISLLRRQWYGLSQKYRDNEVIQNILQSIAAQE